MLRLRYLGLIVLLAAGCRPLPIPGEDATFMPAPTAGLEPPPAGRGWVSGYACVTDNRCGPAAALTQDFGGTWTTLPAPPAAGELAFADEQTGWLLAGGTLFGTPDGGQTWAVIERPGPVAGLALGAGDVWLVERSCQADTTGRAECPLMLAISVDGGRTWETRGPVPESAGSSGVRFRRADAAVAWLVFDAPRAGRRVYVTRDSGLSREGPVSVCAEPYPSLRLLAPADAQTVSAVCSSTVIGPSSESSKAWRRSVDGGRTWLTQREFTDPQDYSGLWVLAEVNDLAVPSAERAAVTQCVDGWLPGTSATDQFRLTWDAGLNWQSAAPADAWPGRACFLRVRFNGPDLGWAWSDEAVVVTQDDGSHWVAAAWPDNFTAAAYPAPALAVPQPFYPYPQP